MVPMEQFQAKQKREPPLPAARWQLPSDRLIRHDHRHFLKSVEDSRSPG